ncbi:hypothetical protein M3P05_20395 [Sansalvadorimonas sp. 2012CJ34-2]|uniref:Uncharacterized protein n=1 Tax=Parendozoicomonas callyspongiae TaxID=2942213 RepID=A0ABT0PLM1_9GAMM|nr:hypothetical protein [Sansalvadorimonas sp. 2012CJ34-2]MCL6272280.1 hypothetical protein [Sansalvadorimonas sp. 2012CJ34-2]
MTSVSFFSCLAILLFAPYCNALSIKITTSSEEGFFVKYCFTDDQVFFKYHQIVVNGCCFDNLKIIDDFQSSEYIEFEYEEDKRSCLSLESSQRLFVLLKGGWQSVISYKRNLELPQDFQCDSPPCSYIFFYVVFGITNFLPGQFSLNNFDQLHNYFKIYELPKHLKLFDIVSISGVINEYNRETVLYVGGNIFISWDPINNIFYFRSGQQVHDSFKGLYNTTILRRKKSFSEIKPNNISAYGIPSLLNPDLGFEMRKDLSIQPYSYIK